MTRLPVGEAVSLQTLARENMKAGGHFFDQETMKFFQSRVVAGPFVAPDGWYLITSEKSPYTEERTYKIRFCTPEAKMLTPRLPARKGLRTARKDLTLILNGTLKWAR